MSRVITWSHMQKYLGKSEAVFPADTVITPAAADWAKEHKVKIIRATREAADTTGQAVGAGQDGETERTRLLHKVIEKSYEKTGRPEKKEELLRIVLAGLERLGCIVDP